ncbi:hypothetical protein [Actinoplanes teichomyceticus]|uniref:DUF3168 domain-containing protein n=1 Tax=Actinoplanes teichomyceticus TaxID=1867 RepID=A0A561WAT0_ACTTI|nr:hypothetical protein [Actinoplanes teichomyceticus]TWG20968.1 hypothetical protein FHX34_103497 [Actinoplanes teichomyceticus]GIF14787.1 hypothetical protein Ate01nite_48190 [Actinoplanes teichomyceticus]
MNSSHAAPVLAALRALTPALTISDGPVDPASPPALPYAVAYVHIDMPEAVSLEEVADRVTCTAIVHSVAGNAEAVRKVTDRVIGALVGLRPEVPGRSCSRLAMVDSRPPDWDRSTGRLVMTQATVFEYVSSPG